MKLPRQISPNPLINTAVEVRFLSKLSNEQLLPLIYGKFHQNLPKLVVNKVPSELRESNYQLKFQPEYVLSNDDFSIGFSKHSVIFENLGDYKLWERYYGFIKDHFSVLLDLDFIGEIERIGVRYGSILENVKGFEDALKLQSSVSIEGFNEKLASYKTNLTKNGRNIFLQITENTKAVRDNVTRVGLLVDIDASTTQHIEQKDVTMVVDELHSLQKELFFNLIKDEYLQSLNPVY